MLGYSSQLYISSICLNSEEDTCKKCIDIDRSIGICVITCIRVTSWSKDRIRTILWIFRISVFYSKDCCLQVDNLPVLLFWPPVSGGGVVLEENPVMFNFLY